MICWVVERVLAASSVTRVIVASDEAMVCKAVRAAGHEAVMTRSDHATGTDRLAEVARSLNDTEIIVNVQGDEPLISAETIDRAIAALRETDNCSITTTWEPIESAADVLSPDVVKVVVDETGRAIYFSRSPVPYPREAVRRHGSIPNALQHEPDLLTTFRKHTGLYVYRRDFLLEFATWPQSSLERAEALEQLRALEHGVMIKVIEASTTSIGVDTIEDLERVREIMKHGSRDPRVSSLRSGEINTARFGRMET